MYINNSLIFHAQTTAPDFLLDWREYSFSLTEKLKHAKGAADLHLLFQNWTQHNWWDNHILNIKEGGIFQREIFMKHLGIEYWYARSIIPEKCYTVCPEFFDRLKKESIKNLIFHNEHVVRTQMIIYPVNEQCLEYHWVKKYKKNLGDILWVRLAEYSFQDIQSFYIIEILFPSLGAVT